MQVKPLNSGRESPNIPEQQIQQRLDASESKLSLVNIKPNVQKCRRHHEVKSLHQKIKMLFTMNGWTVQRLMEFVACRK